MEKTTFKPINLEKAIQQALFIQKCKDFLGLRKKHNDQIRITPIVTFFKGTLQNPVKHIASTKGHLVNAGLIDLCNRIGINTYNSYNSWASGFAVGGSGIPAVPSIRLGTGGGETTTATTALTSIVNTPPNTISGSLSLVSAGYYRCAVTATWNAGSLAALTITEAAYWAMVASTLQAFSAAGVALALAFVDRVSSADEDFNSFVVDIAKPLSCQYQYNFIFA